MNKLALIGKDIAHSLSPALYKELISQTIQYDLLDYKESTEIPLIQNLFSIYDGINITSPYKEHFIKDVELSSAAFKLQAINCLAKSDGVYYGENTDYLAVIEILKRLIKKHSSLKVIILGDGVMSRVVETALEELSQSFVIYSRKLSLDFDKLDLNSFGINNDFPLIINTCSRDYVCHLPMPNEGLFWDLNYNFKPHLDRFKFLKITYVDGYEMLKLQAKYALAFWSGK